MAVHKDHPGLQVHVVVKDKPLQEYDEHVEFAPEANTVTKYVEAVAGSNFSIVLHFDKSFPRNRGVACKVLVDGHNIASPVVSTHLRCLPYTWCVDSVSQYDGNSFMGYHHGGIRGNKLRFVELSHGDGPNIFGPEAHLSGQIEVRASFAQITPSLKAATHPCDFSGLVRVPESAVKGDVGSLGARLGAPCYYTARTPMRVQREETFAIFKFKYRSRADLQALRVVEPEPEPEYVPFSAPSPLDTVQHCLPTFQSAGFPKSIPKASFPPPRFDNIAVTREVLEHSSEKLGQDTSVPQYCPPIPKKDVSPEHERNAPFPPRQTETIAITTKLRLDTSASSTTTPYTFEESVAGLTDQELIGLIAPHRVTGDQGLQTQSRERLEGLLRHHEEEIKKKKLAAERGIIDSQYVQRKRENDGSGSEGRKRIKHEVIVLDG